MALIDRVKERTGSDLSDAELQAMIDGIADEMDMRFGAAGPQTVLLGNPADPATAYRLTLRLVRPLDETQAVEIVEIDPGDSGDAAAQVVLAADDYRVLHGGRSLQRLSSGTHGRNFWAPLVSVTFTPKGEQAARDEATIQLIQLQLSYRGGLRSERAGDYSFTLSGDMSADREKIFEGLAQRRGMVMA